MWSQYTQEVSPFFQCAIKWHISITKTLLLLLDVTTNLEVFQMQSSGVGNIYIPCNVGDHVHHSRVTQSLHPRLALWGGGGAIRGIKGLVYI